MSPLDRAAALILDACALALLACLAAIVIGFAATLVSSARSRRPAERDLPTAEDGRFWVAFEPDTGLYYGECVDTNYTHAASCPWEALRGIRRYVRHAEQVRRG